MRRNPSLITFCNPKLAPKQWAAFHYTSRDAAAWVNVPDIKDVPTNQWSLGFATGVEFENGRKVAFRWSEQDGPWLLSETGNKRSLWIVSRNAARMNGLREQDGEIIRAVLYIPSKTSGKYVPGSSFRHVFGDGGPLPKNRWPEIYPQLQKVAANAYAIVPPRGGFHVEPNGITN